MNLGCPQRVAHSGHFGSYLLDEVDRPLVISMVKMLAENLTIPVFVKIRLLNSVPETIILCQQLATAGASLITIHARYRVNLVGRSGPGARDGAAHLDQVVEIVNAMKSDPDTQHVKIIANGNVITWEDVQNNKKFTGADGIMSAEGILDNPALFNGGVPVDEVGLTEEYIEFAAKHPVKLKSVIFHVRRMCRATLLKYQLLEDLVASEDMLAVRRVIATARGFVVAAEEEAAGKLKDRSRLFVFDNLKAKKAKEAAERKKREEVYFSFSTV